MSKMSDIDILCKDISLKAKHAIKAGEKMEDVSDAVFEQVFNIVGRDAEAKGWAMNTANSLMAHLISEREASERLALRAPELREQLAIALYVIQDLRSFLKKFSDKDVEDLHRDEIHRIELILEEAEFN